MRVASWACCDERQPSPPAVPNGCLAQRSACDRSPGASPATSGCSRTHRSARYRFWLVRPSGLATRAHAPVAPPSAANTFSRSAGDCPLRNNLTAAVRAIETCVSSRMKSSDRPERG